MRGRCYLLLGRLDEALADAKDALSADPTMVKGERHVWGSAGYGGGGALWN